MTDRWNKCDVCGKFIPYDDFADGSAKRELVTPSAHGTEETYETLCRGHNNNVRDN